MKVNRSTPIMVVEKIELSLEFWQKRLGYNKTVEVPHGSEIGFVMLEKDGLEVMLQTRKSILDDLPSFERYLDKQTVVQYMDVESLDDVLKCLEGMTLLVPPRKTFYGMREAYLCDPAGYIVGFAEKVK